MMNGASHLDENTLVRLLDGELDGAERASMEAHLEACPPCRERFDALQARDRAVRAWLERHDPPPPESWDYNPPAPRRGAGGWGRSAWATAAAVLLVVVVAVGPARGWILGGLGMRAPSAPDLAASAPVDGEGGGAASTSFLPVSAEVIVDLSTRPGPRALTVESTKDDRVRLVVLEPGAELLLRRGGLEVRDPALEARGYRLLVPAGVHRVRVVLGSGRDTVLTVPPEGTPQTLRLDPT